MTAPLPCPPADYFTPESRRAFKWNVFAALGYEPDAWQRLFHESDAQHRILPCGTRVGKTFCLTPEVIAAAIFPSPKSLEAREWVGARIWCVAPNYELADKLFLPVARGLKRHFPKWLEGTYSERDRFVGLRGGGFVQGKSADNPDSLVGEELDAAVIDEAPRVGEHEKELVKQRLATRNGWFAAIGSPVPCKWFERDFQRGQGTGWRYDWEGEPLPGVKYAGCAVRFVPGAGERHPEYFSLSVPTHANSRIKISWLLDQEQTSPERIFRQDLLAEFQGNEGQVFKHFDPLATAQRTPAGVPGRRYVVGWDVGRARDFSVLSVIDVAAREQVFVDRFQGSWLTQYDRVERVCRLFRLPWLVMDATGKGDAPFEEMQRRNVLHANPVEAEARRKAGLPVGAFASRVEPVQISTNAVKRELVENLAAGFDQGLLRILPDPIQLQELRLYEFKQSDATQVIRYSAPPGFHDDTVMALALAWWRTSRPMGTAQCYMA